MKHMALLLILQFSLTCVGCASARQQGVSGYPWNLDGRAWQSVLIDKATQAKAGDDAALRDLLWFQLVTDTERGELLSWRIGEVYQANPAWFLKIASREPSDIRDATYVTLEYEGLAVTRAALQLQDDPRCGGG